MQQIARINTQAADFDFARLTALGQPAVLTGWVDHWPALQAAKQGPAALTQYLRPLDNNTEMDTLLLAADTQGKVGYADTNLQQFNFERRRYPVWAVLAQLLRQMQQPDAVRIALQSARLDSCLPDFSRQNPMPGLSSDVVGRVWIGNQTVVPAHFDHSDNLACVLSGSRTFTLFPPEQAVNLYIGPLQSAPTGAPVSLVDMLNPDFARFPRYTKALEVAQQATLEPGDVLFLPALWWHHVQARTSFNLLVNYWWGGSVGSAAKAASPYSALLHALLALNGCSSTERQQWQALFNYFVFHEDADNFSHIPPQTPAVQREVNSKDQQAILTWLLQELTKQAAPN